MTIPFRYLSGAAMAALIGAGCLSAGFLLQDLAGAQQEVATQQFDHPDATLERAEGYFEHVSRIPGFGNDRLNDVRARRGALRYWQGRHGLLAPPGDPVGAVPADNVELQVVVANAVYRARQAEAKDRESALSALSEGMSGYLTALKNSRRREDAAFNYEYLYRLRDEIEKAKPKVGLPAVASDGPLGSAASPDKPSSGKTDFKTLAPLEIQEIDKANAGKGGLQIKRKG